MRMWEYLKGLPSGICGMVAAAFIYQALACLIQIKEKWWCKALLAIGCWQACSMIIYIGDCVNLSLSMTVFLAILWFTCEGTGGKKFTLGLMFGSTIFAFNGFYDECIGFIAHSHGKDDLYADMYLVGRLLFAVFLYFIIRYQKAEKDFELSAPLWRLMFWLTFCPLGILLSVILLRNPFWVSDEGIYSDIVLLWVVILSFIGLLRALVVLERQQKLERENLLANQNQRYYEAMEQQQFEIRRLRHDLSNHLQTLHALPGQKKDEYIKGILDNPAFEQVLAWCGDPTINAVLTTKESLMRQKGIHFLAKVDIGEELPFEKADLCAIFANALDNAVEGCIELAEPLREIVLDARAGKGILAVSIRNACKSIEDMEHKGKRAAQNIFPQTTKKDAQNHGIGLRSIQETVKKYGGNMEIERKGETFNLFLYLPLS